MARRTQTAVMLSRLGMAYKVLLHSLRRPRRGKGWRDLRASGDDGEDELSEIFRLAVADAVDVAQFVLGLWLRSGDLAQGGVVEDDVRRDAAAARDLHA